MSAELPPQIQNMVAQLQQLQQQLQTVVTQKAQLDLLVKETEEAIREVEESKQDSSLFKAVGNVLVKVEKEKLLKELQEKKETYEIRIKTLERQEEKLKERVTEIQKKLQSMLSPQAG